MSCSAFGPNTSIRWTIRNWSKTPWTPGPPGSPWSSATQAVRFFVVSLLAEAFSLALLTLLVQGAGVGKVPAQAVAVATSMPLNFLGNKLWSFR